MFTSTFNQMVWFRLRLREAIHGRIAGERGASLVEYALLVALIAMVCIGAITILGTETGDSVSRTANSVAAAN
jgi:pilus assembly protein Flp/PilA